MSQKEGRRGRVREEIKYENVKITQRIFNVEKAEAAKGMLAGCVYTQQYIHVVAERERERKKRKRGIKHKSEVAFEITIIEK